MMIYDHFTPFVIFSLEAYGFCKPGEGGPFVEDGRIEFDGELPGQHAWRQPLRGLHPRAAAHHRGGAPAARHVDRADRRTPS